MFGKKCERCGRKVSKKANFCSYCGLSFDSRLDGFRDVGVGDVRNLDDEMKEFEKSLGMPFFMKFPFRKLVKELSRELDKQLSDVESDGKESKKGVRIRIGAFGGEPMVDVEEIGSGRGVGNARKGKARKGKRERFPEFKMTKKQKERFAKLPRREPQASVRRLGGKVVYEILLPGVKNLKDIMVGRVESGIEIKAFSKAVVYVKVIPVDLDVVGCDFQEGKLFVEFNE